MSGSTVLAVRFERYGEADVLEVVEVPRPHPGPGRVVVDVVAAAINPGEASIRRGLLHDLWPSTFPSGEGSDLAGAVAEIGEGVNGVAVGDEVIGWSDERSSHAQAVSLPANQVVPKPSTVSWEAAGSLYVAGTTAWATLKSVGLKPGEVVAISGAAGGVGSIAIQLARRLGATVLGIAGAGNSDWLDSMGTRAVVYGEGLGDRLRAAAGGGSTPSSTASAAATSTWPSTNLASGPIEWTRSSTGRREHDTEPMWTECQPSMTSVASSRSSHRKLSKESWQFRSQPPLPYKTSARLTSYLNGGTPEGRSFSRLVMPRGLAPEYLTARVAQFFDRGGPPRRTQGIGIWN